MPHRFQECACLDVIGDHCECCHVCGLPLEEERHQVALRELADDGASLPRERGSGIELAESSMP
jgi:hypothetical protein